MAALPLLAAALLTLAGLLHSYLGERMVLPPMLRRAALPLRLERIVRLAWHATSLAWLGFAALFALLARGGPTPRGVALAAGITFIATAAMVLVGSRGRHFAWALFLAVGLIGWWVGR